MLVAADQALRCVGLPALPLWELLLHKDVVIEFLEDNQAMIAVMKTGRSPTMRAINRTHRICISWMHETCSKDLFMLRYVKSDEQAADIFTKAYTDFRKWDAVCELIGHDRPARLWKPSIKLKVLDEDPSNIKPKIGDAKPKSAALTVNSASAPTADFSPSGGVPQII